MKKDYIRYLEDKIRHFEWELEAVERSSVQAENRADECQGRYAKEKRLRECAEEELKRVCLENSELRAKAVLMESDGRNLHAELEKMNELSEKHKEALKRIKDLEKKPNIRNGTEDPYGINTPSSKKVNEPNSTEENRAKRGGAKVGHKGAGRKDFTTEEADTIKHNNTPPLTPCCENPSLKHTGMEYHAVYNFKPMELERVMNINAQFHCDNCGQDLTAPTPDAMSGAKYSNAAAAQIITECYFHQAAIGGAARRMKINKGTLIGMAHRYAEKLKPLFDHIIFEMRKSIFLHADETGWSMDGKKAYAWIFANDAFKVFLFRDSRGSKVPEEALGNKKLMLILITDRYRGYIPLLVERQLCFVHILRDVEKLKLEFPDDKQIVSFCESLIPHLSAAITLRTLGLKSDEYLKRAALLQSEIMNICNAQSNDPGIQKIQDIFRLNETQLFHWVENPEIPCENNYAERGLRPIVISRKISFGCQSEQGMQTREILMTILHTAKCRGHDPVEFLEKALNLLTSNPNADLIPLFFPSDEPVLKKTA